MVIQENLEALKQRVGLAARIKTVEVLTEELVKNINDFDFEQRRQVLRLLLWGQPGMGVFLKPDWSAEIRGLIDLGLLGGGAEIANTTFSRCGR